jgi:hypothetical protein
VTIPLAAVLECPEGPDDVIPVNRAGRSARARAEALRRRRREGLLRTWPVVLLAVATAFIFGLLLPRVIFAAMSSFLTSLVPDSPGLREWSSMPALSWTLGTAMALAALVGLVRPSRSESAWRTGASGERRVGRTLHALREQGVQVVHDVAMPGSSANIDHVAVTPSGVFTIETKRYTGKLEVRSRGTELWIAGRNRSALLDQARRQSEVIGTTLARAGKPEVPVTPLLCLVDTELPLLFPPKQANGVLICTRRSLSKRLVRRLPITLPGDEMAQITAILQDSLSSA